MTESKEYHRPADLAEALRLLQRSDARTVPLAGGSWLAPRLRAGVPGSVAAKVDAVVDLADLGLRYIERRQERGEALLCLGATTTLTDLTASIDCGQLAGGLLAAAARREGPVNLRNVATIGGCVARADGYSELLLALLALDAQVQIQNGRKRTLPLADLAAGPAALGRGLITVVRLPWQEGLGGGLARVARTPADQGIVAAAVVTDGHTARVALGGVAPRPLLLHLENLAAIERAVAEAAANAAGVANFLGSDEYRQAMAPLLAQRALADALASR